MPKTLYIGDEIKVLFGKENFIELVDEMMGNDAKNYLRRLLTQEFAEGHRLGYREAEDFYCDDEDSNYMAGYDDGYDEGWADGHAAGESEQC